MPVRLSSALIAEFVGTFALTFIGVMAIHSAPAAVGGVGLVGVALAHGLILAIMVTAAMPTSGGHLNPAVTVGFLLTGKIKTQAAVAYIVSQVAGSIFAALAAYVICRGSGVDVVHGGTPNLGTGVGASAALLAEIIASFFLIFAVWGTAADPRHVNVGGFAIGLTIAADILAVGPISGASMNPARSFGPTLVAAMLEGHSELWKNHWVYWVGPIVGGGIAALTYHLALWPRDEKRGIDPAAADVPDTQRPET